MDINNKRIILYLGSLLFVAYIFSIFIFASFINNMNLEILNLVRLVILI
jgi:hypothetical protein